MNLKNITCILEENKQIKIQLEKIKSVFLNLWNETEQKASQAPAQHRQNADDMEKKMRQVLSENDKLKTLLRYARVTQVPDRPPAEPQPVSRERVEGGAKSERPASEAARRDELGEAGRDRPKEKLRQRRDVL